jgi:YihY family inner membrane protein
MKTASLEKGRRPIADPISVFAVGVLVGLCVIALEARPRDRAQVALPAPAPLDHGRGLGDLAKRIWARFNADQIPAVAGGATFFCLLALFPALGVFVSLFGLFADVEKARRDILHLHGILPQGAIAVLTDQLTLLASVPHTRLGLTFATSLLLSLWSSNAGMKSLIAGLNVAYQEKERRNFIQLNLVSFALTVGGLIVAVAVAAFPGVPPGGGLARSALAAMVRWAIWLASIVAGLSLIYRYGPCRPRARWPWITPGALHALCVALWPIQQNLRGPGRGGRLHDLDLALAQRRAARRGTGFRTPEN